MSSIAPVISLRLDLMIKRMLNDPRVTDDFASTNPALGDPPIGWDNVTIKGEFCGRLNDNVDGFTDVLVKKIVPGDVDDTTKFNNLVVTIVKKTGNPPKTIEAYQSQIAERARLGFREAIATLTGIDPKLIMPFQPLATYYPNTSQAATRALMTAIEQQLWRYLLSGLLDAELDRQKMIDWIQRRLVKRMLP